MSGKYDWLEDLPTNPPKPGDTSTRNTLQPAQPNYGYPPRDYQPKNGDYIATPRDARGSVVDVELVGGTFRATFYGMQPTLVYFSRLFKAEGKSTQVWQRLANGQLSPMVLTL